MLVEAPDLPTFVAGDWHGDVAHMLSAVMRASHRAPNGANIVQVGDFGLFPEVTLLQVQILLAANNINLYWIDGNHEDFSLVYSQPSKKTGGYGRHENITYMPRGSFLTIGDEVWVLMGGAHSVDRAYRQEGTEWWPEEDITAADVYYLKQSLFKLPEQVRNCERTVLVTHEAPIKSATVLANIATLRHKGFKWPDYDEAMSRVQQYLVQQVADLVRPVVHYHGHHHLRYTEETEYGRVEGLGDNSGPLRSNLILHTKEI